LPIAPPATEIEIEWEYSLGLLAKPVEPEITEDIAA
jgi:hypothetical protein